MRHLRQTWWSLMVCALLPAGVDAQFPNYPEPNLPELKSCLHDTPQPLPAKWEAITLMAPYLYTGEPHNFFKLPERASLRVGKLVYDAKAKLMRATLVGVSDPQTRPLDLLITDGPTQPPPIDPLRIWGVNWVGFLGSRMDPYHCFLKVCQFSPPRKSSRFNSPLA